MLLNSRLTYDDRLTLVPGRVFNSEYFTVLRYLFIGLIVFFVEYSGKRNEFLLNVSSLDLLFVGDFFMQSALGP